MNQPAPSLYWLPRHDDFAAALRDAKRIEDAEPRLRALADLAGHRRDFIETTNIDRLLQRSSADLPADVEGLQHMRLAILGSSTVDHLLPGIRVAGLHRGLLIDILLGDYGQYRQLVQDPASALYDFAPQAVYFSIDAADALAPLPLDASAARVDDAIAARVDELRQLWRLVRERLNATAVQQTVLNLALPVFGNYDAAVPAAPANALARFNHALCDAAARDGALIVDLDGWASQAGRRWWSDPVLWHSAKQEVPPQNAPVFGDLVARTLAALRGRSRKCLVLDLDNTLWGGVVGDDGLDGIVLGQGSALGEAHQAFQAYAKKLADRGIILAVCSKNDAETAEAAFRDHPEMVLAREDIASFVANWGDKPANLRRIARELNIALEALVFFDDNPAEREIVRRTLPAVAVPEVPEEAALFGRCLADAGYFEAIAFTGDDRLRTRQYAANAERNASHEAATDMDGFLRGLSMSMSAKPFDKLNMPRITQLVNKTNQFNLTTRRYGEAELVAMMDDPRILTLQCRLADKFGDNGMISVIVAKPEDGGDGKALVIDTWLMSCRVLGRQVECAALDVMVEEARRLGAERLIGEFLPTARNGLVKDHYRNLGFAAGSGDAEASRWTFALRDHKPHETHISIKVGQ